MEREEEMNFLVGISCPICFIQSLTLLIEGNREGAFLAGLMGVTAGYFAVQNVKNEKGKVYGDILAMK